MLKKNILGIEHSVFSDALVLLLHKSFQIEPYDDANFAPTIIQICQK
jgi:hypothetical protein